MNDLSRNETIVFITKQEFPEYFLLKKARSKNRYAHRLDGAEQDLIKSIGAYIRKLRGMSLTEIADLKTEANKKYSERIAANKSRCLEASKQKDEELFFNYPSQQADFEFWAKMGYWTVDEAVALSFGRNPETVNWNSVFPYTDTSPFAKKYKKIRTLVQRACKCGALIRPIAPIQFLCWASKIEITFPDELISLVQGTPKGKEYEAPASDSQPVQKAAKNPFDPLPISTIAKIFNINQDVKNNLDTWKKYSRQAKRNGLDVARVEVAKGSGRSTFDPQKVGDWLIDNGHMEPEKVNRKLDNNLPKRSEHLKGTFVQ